ncbi:hypothetical protein RUM43_006973 [Polyplax serrata]|uniref:Uncharacterized protein n=1 Tax=Polyplax serrata TaxID=468196 RepID=A0AAN8PM10_POLSC
MMNGTNNRVLADLMDSSFGLSPMRNLTVNFSGTSLSSTPRYKLSGRRLSMSNLTPETPSDSSSLDIADGKCGTPR